MRMRGLPWPPYYPISTASALFWLCAVQLICGLLYLSLAATQRSWSCPVSIEEYHFVLPTLPSILWATIGLQLARTSGIRAPSAADGIYAVTAFILGGLDAGFYFCLDSASS